MAKLAQPVLSDEQYRHGGKASGCEQLCILRRQLMSSFRSYLTYVVLVTLL